MGLKILSAPVSLGSSSFSGWFWSSLPATSRGSRFTSSVGSNLVTSSGGPVLTSSSTRDTRTTLLSKRMRKGIDNTTLQGSLSDKQNSDVILSGKVTSPDKVGTSGVSRKPTLENNLTDIVVEGGQKSVQPLGASVPPRGAHVPSLGASVLPIEASVPPLGASVPLIGASVPLLVASNVPVYNNENKSFTLSTEGLKIKYSLRDLHRYLYSCTCVHGYTDIRAHGYTGTC